MTQVQVSGEDMTSICRLVCMLVAASAIALATSAIISAATAKPDSPTGGLGTEHVYHAHAGLCKSKNPAHSFAANRNFAGHFALKPRTPGLLASYQCMCSRPAGHTIDDQSECQTICDWNTSCAAYEWGAGCYLSSEWGFEATRYPDDSRVNWGDNRDNWGSSGVLVRYTPFARAALHIKTHMGTPAAPCACALLRPYRALAAPVRPCTHERPKHVHVDTLEFLCQVSGRRATCYLKSIPPDTDAKSCVGSATPGGCDDVIQLSASLAIAHAKKIVMTGNHDVGRWMRRDDQLAPLEERLKQLHQEAAPNIFH